jgi:hypothetical protein
MRQHQQIAAPSSATPGRMVLRRACACGTRTASDQGVCPECQRKRLQPKLVVGGAHDQAEREADRVAATVMQGFGSSAGDTSGIMPNVQRASTEPSTSGPEPAAPPIVDRVLAGSGQPLHPGAQRFFEARFGRDFGSVRVHTDAEAASSARAVDAHAYTVGNHLVFGASRYAPETAAGQYLLAHELTHVVQQGAALRRDSISPPIDVEEQEEDAQPVQRLRRHVAITGLDEAGPGADLTGERENEMYRLSERDKKLAECKKAAGPDPALCNPASPLSWSSFGGTPPDKAALSAKTFSTVESVEVPSQKCEETITGYASGPTKRFQGVFAADKSWVKPEFRDSGDPTKNGSVAAIAKCESGLAALAAAGRVGGFKDLDSRSDPRCPAAVRARGDHATTKEECTTILGKDFNDAKTAESMRLLNHEQNHLALTCAVAKKGNDLLGAGERFDKVDAKIHAKRRAVEVQYDNDSHHGCDAAQQAAWETKITGGLPDLKLLP